MPLHELGYFSYFTLKHIIPQFKKAAPIKIIFQTEIISKTVTRSVFLSGKMRQR